MNLSRYYRGFGDRGDVIAIFGDSRLIKYLDGRYDLVGGSANDRAEAKEWISLFCHDVVVGNDGFRKAKSR